MSGRVKISGRKLRREHYRMYVRMLAPVFGRRGAAFALQNEGAGWRTPEQALACAPAALLIADAFTQEARR